METPLSTYPIHIGSGLETVLKEEIDGLVAAGSKLAVVTDESVRQALDYLFDGVLTEVPRIAVPSGETSKSLETFGRILDFLASSKLDRGGVLIAVGGGVVGDLSGYAAASYLRGIRFIQVPTTLLAMVDSSVGGKTGINIAAGKNLVGAFHQPISVYADIATLSTLPPREFAAGMSEVIKYGLLADLELFEELEQNPILSFADSRLSDIVKRCCQIKADVVNADEKETAASGGRALLNLGHTFGHAIENVAGYGEYLHGEAISVGQVAAARLSEMLGHIPSDDVQRTARCFAAHGLPTRLAKPLGVSKLIDAMYLDKKVRSGSIRFVVTRSLGDAITTDAVEMDSVKRIWEKLGAE